MTAGQDFVKKIRPVGVVLFLLLFVLFFYITLSSGANPIPGYTPPQDAAYYAQSARTLAELKAELEANVFSRVAGVTGCEIEDGKLVITIDGASFATTRSAIEKFYGDTLFVFVEGGE